MALIVEVKTLAPSETNLDEKYPGSSSAFPETIQRATTVDLSLPDRVVFYNLM